MRLICWNKGGCKNNSNLPEYYGCGGETEKVVQCCAEYNGFYDTIEALQQENERLKAELSQWSHLGDTAATELVTERLHYIPKLKQENEQLRANLRKARQVLDQINRQLCKDEYDRFPFISDVIAEIDKAI